MAEETAVSMDSIDMEPASTSDEKALNQIYPIIAFVSSKDKGEESQWEAFKTLIGARRGRDDSGNLFINMMLNLSRYAVVRPFAFETHISYCASYVQKINESADNIISEDLIEAMTYGLAYRTYKFQNYDSLPSDEVWQKSLDFISNYKEVADTIEDYRTKEFYIWSIYNIGLQVVAFLAKVESPTIKSSIDIVSTFMEIRDASEDFRNFADTCYNGEFVE